MALISSFSLQRETPTNGATININPTGGTLFLILAPATDLTSLTLAWPSSPPDCSTVVILSTTNISGITHTGNSLNSAFTSIKASGAIAFVYDLAGGTYMVSQALTSSSQTTLQFTTTVTSAGNAFVYPTSDGTATGTPLFSSISAVVAFPTLPNPLVSCGKSTVAGNLKTITIPSQTLSFNGIVLLSTNILGSYSVGNTANAVAVTVVVTGVLAS